MKDNVIDLGSDFGPNIDLTFGYMLVADGSGGFGFDLAIGRRGSRAFNLGDDADRLRGAGGHAMLGRCLDPDRDGARPEIDRQKTLRLGEREKRVSHQVLRIARREVAGQSPEELELLGLRMILTQPPIVFRAAHQHRSLPA
jgi:hypothetical protein